MKIDVLHVRDPDSACVLRVFVDGKEIDYTETTYGEDSIDVGAGWDRDEWDERIADVEGLPPSQFRDALLEVLRDPPGAKYIHD